MIIVSFQITMDEHKRVPEIWVVYLYEDVVDPGNEPMCAPGQEFS